MIVGAYYRRRSLLKVMASTGLWRDPRPPDIHAARERFAAAISVMSAKLDGRFIRILESHE
jgi:hypothetical protein